MRCNCDFIITFAPHLEDWQSDRMRWTRNPVYALKRIGGLNPSTSASKEDVSGVHILFSYHSRCKSVIGILLYMTATGMNRHSQQMCGCPPRIVLSVNTGRVDGPLLATYCRGWEQLVAGEEQCRQNSFK